MNRIFQFEVVSGKVCLSDPCYERSETGCGKFDVPAKNGVWLATVQYNDEGRVENATYKHFDSVLSRLGISNYEFGVDSGQFGIFDSSIWEDESEWHNDTGITPFYGKCCDLTCYTNEQGGVVDGLGFVSSTGYGDGGYDGWGYYTTDNVLAGFRIEFIKDSLDEPEEDDEDDGDYYGDDE